MFGEMRWVVVSLHSNVFRLTADCLIIFNAIETTFTLYIHTIGSLFCPFQITGQGNKHFKYLIYWLKNYIL